MLLETKDILEKDKANASKFHIIPWFATKNDFIKLMLLS
jgi:hypothetical protein